MTTKRSKKYEVTKSNPNPVPEDSKGEYIVVTMNLTVMAESEFAAADRIADLCRRLAENGEIDGWDFQSIETEAHARTWACAPALLSDVTERNERREERHGRVI